MERNGYGHQRNTGFDVGATAVATIWVVVMLLVYIMRPQILILGKTIVVTQGIVIPGLLVGAFFWGLIELYTAPGTGKIHTIIRPLIGFLTGMLVGGLLGLDFNFGQYLVVPAFNGNVYAVYELVAVLVAYILFVIEAAWWHNKSTTHAIARKFGSR